MRGKERGLCSAKNGIPGREEEDKERREQQQKSAIEEKARGHVWAGKEDQQGVVVKMSKIKSKSHPRHLLPVGCG